MPRDRCARCLPVIRCCCLVVCLHVASFHVIIRIASACFRKLASVPVSSLHLLSILSPDTLARARGTSEYYFISGRKMFLEWVEGWRVVLL